MIKSLFYVLDEHHNPVPTDDVLTWGHWFEKSSNRVVGHTQINSEVEISTVFLGLDHSFSSEGPPILFETMVFHGSSGGQTRRYISWDDAVTGHDAMVKKIKRWLNQKMVEKGGDGMIKSLLPKPVRACGGCTLCCKLLPMSNNTAGDVADTVKLMTDNGYAEAGDFAGMVPDFDKPAGQDCKHQCGAGCAIYENRPFGCRTWQCMWLSGLDVPPPETCHYVVDSVPDEIQVGHPDGRVINLPVIQVWVDPEHRDAYHDPKLLDFINNTAKKKLVAAIVRYGTGEDCFVMFPPALTGQGWVEKRDGRVSDEIGIDACLRRNRQQRDADNAKRQDPAQ